MLQVFFQVSLVLKMLLKSKTISFPPCWKMLQNVHSTSSSSGCDSDLSSSSQLRVELVVSQLGDSAASAASALWAFTVLGQKASTCNRRTTVTKAIKGASGSKDGVTLPARAASQARAGHIVRSRVGRSKPQISLWETELGSSGKNSTEPQSHGTEYIRHIYRHRPFVGKWFRWTARIIGDSPQTAFIGPSFRALTIVSSNGDTSQVININAVAYSATVFKHHKSYKSIFKTSPKRFEKIHANHFKTPRDQSRQCHAHILLYAPTPNPRHTSSTGSGQPATATKEECTNECYNESTTLQGNKHCDHTEHIHLTRKWETKRQAVAKQQPRSSLFRKLRCFCMKMKGLKDDGWCQKSQSLNLQSYISILQKKKHGCLLSTKLSKIQFRSLCRQICSHEMPSNTGKTRRELHQTPSAIANHFHHNWH